MPSITATPGEQRGRLAPRVGRSGGHGAGQGQPRRAEWQQREGGLIPGQAPACRERPAWKPILVSRSSATRTDLTVHSGSWQLETDFLFPSSLRQVFLVCLHGGPPEIQGPATFIPTVGLSITCTPSTERRKRLGVQGPGLGGARSLCCSPWARAQPHSHV